MPLSVVNSSSYRTNFPNTETGGISINFALADFSQSLFVVCQCVDGTGSIVPSGWSSLPVAQTSGGMRMTIMYKYAPTGNVTFTYSGSRRVGYGDFTINGADPLTPIQQGTAVTGSSPTLITTPQITNNGSSGDWYVTLNALFTTGSTGAALANTPPTGGIDSAPASRLPDTNSFAAEGGPSSVTGARASFPTPGTTRGGYNYQVFAGGSWPGGCGWASYAFRIKTANSTGGRRFFMIV